VALSLFAGLISAFVDNVATVLMVAPLGLAVSKQIRTDPVPVLISIAVSSNLQGAATLVGDTTSILLGSYANMSFNDFFWFHGRPGLFFVVEAGAILTVPVLLYLFRKETGKIQSDQKTEVKDYLPTVLLAGVILSLIAASQFENKPELTNGMICMAFAVLGTAAAMIREKSTEPLMRVLKSVDYETLLLLTGLFIVIGGITEAGVIDAVAGLFVKIGGGSKLLMYVLIVAVSVAVSAFVDNIPYVATMLPVIRGITAALGVEPYLLYFGLLTGATLGGNLTPIGASANITATGLLKREGYEISFGDFAKIGIPFTLIAVMTGYLFIWFVWA
jgi:Na+/H+ antiporter NhaD/arsenite permease-like protein